MSTGDHNMIYIILCTFPQNGCMLSSRYERVFAMSGSIVNLPAYYECLSLSCLHIHFPFTFNRTWMEFT